MKVYAHSSSVPSCNDNVPLATFGHIVRDITCTYLQRACTLLHKLFRRQELLTRLLLLLFLLCHISISYMFNPCHLFSYLKRSSIRTSFCTMPECIPLSTPYVVTIVVTKLFRVLVSSLNIAILLRSFSS